MKILTSIIRLIRWPNLLMMAATLILTRYCIFLPVYEAAGISLQTTLPAFLLLVAATLLIGAGGYVVNDILDIGLDSLNKPGQNQIGATISEKMAWNLYYGLNIAGVAAGAWLSYQAGKPELGILFLLIATSLYYYSLKYKYLPFWGNLTVSLLTAFTVAVVWLFEFFFLKQSPGDFITVSTNFAFLNRLVFGYSFLAFYTSIIREIIKDSQDKEGDQRFGCRTIPVLLGDRKTRWIVLVLLALLVALLSFTQVYFYKSFRLLALFLGMVSLLAIYSIIRLVMWKSQPGWGHLSIIAKSMLAAGLVSMVFLWFPN